MFETLIEAAGREGIFALTSAVLLIGFWKSIHYVFRQNEKREDRYIQIIAEQKKANREYITKLQQISNSLANLAESISNLHNDLAQHDSSIESLEEKLDDINYRADLENEIRKREQEIKSKGGD